jgi:hypothetical protein
MCILYAIVHNMSVANTVPLMPGKDISLSKHL